MITYRVVAVWSEKTTDLQEVSHIIEECDVQDVNVLNTAESNDIRGAVFSVSLNPDKVDIAEIETALERVVIKVEHTLVSEEVLI